MFIMWKPIGCWRFSLHNNPVSQFFSILFQFCCCWPRVQNDLFRSILYRVCGFNGAYYCTGCMATEQFQIPARVIFNWDFKKYTVSQKAAAFLLEFQHQSFIDLKILNPHIYQYVDEMAELQSLRIQLNFIRAYLFTCCAPIVEKLRKQLWTKEYLYEHIHRYTLVDLQRIPKRVLAEQLRKVVAFGRQHILECPLCSQKGFICEKCQSNKVLYPFDIETTYKVR